MSCSSTVSSQIPHLYWVIDHHILSSYPVPKLLSITTRFSIKWRQNNRQKKTCKHVIVHDLPSLPVTTRSRSPHGRGCMHQEKRYERYGWLLLTCIQLVIVLPINMPVYSMESKIYDTAQQQTVDVANTPPSFSKKTVLDVIIASVQFLKVSCRPSRYDNNM